MTPAVPLFVELCAGTAALSVRLQGGPKARPPVSRMGAKTGYADTILAAPGLRAGQGAAHYLWCEPDVGVRLLLHAYRDPTLARAAAEVIRGWADEEPRALWERLRAEGPPVLAEGVEAREVARWARIVTSNRLIPVHFSNGRWCNSARNTGPKGGLSFGGEDYCTPSESLIQAFGAVAPHPATILPDATEVDPVDLPPGTIAYMDPPYLGTTGYGHDLPRAAVLDMARRWADAGATVVISEAAPLGEHVHDPIEPIGRGALDGWHCYEVTLCRVGQKRTFSAQQREFITMNRPADSSWAAGIGARNLREREALPEPEQLALWGAA